MRELLALSQLVGPTVLYRLCSVSEPAAIFSMSESELTAIERIGPVTARKILAFDDWRDIDRQLKECEARGIQLIPYTDPRHPCRFHTTGTAWPPMLYVKGTVEPLDYEGIAVVGSRSCDSYGVRMAVKIAQAVVATGRTVISGMARGIDSHAHRGAIEARGRTLAIMGSGLDKIYPPENRDLYYEIAEHGGVVSFFPLGTPPMGVNFPRRNELIVQLAFRVCVVQASLQSGALNTATWARKHRKPLYGVPGQVDLPESQGIIHLLHEGARPLWSAEQIVEDLEPISRLTPKYKKRNEKVDKPGRVVHLFEDTNRGASPVRKETPPPEGEEGAIFALLSDDPLHVDEVTALGEMPSRRVGELLLQLELAGRVEQLPGGYYRKIR